MNVISRLLARADAGFTLWQKIGLSVGLMVYWVFPLDCLPDLIPLIGQIDDVFFTYVIFRVWRSPTLPTDPHGGIPAAVI